MTKELRNENNDNVTDHENNDSRVEDENNDSITEKRDEAKRKSRCGMPCALGALSGPGQDGFVFHAPDEVDRRDAAAVIPVAAAETEGVLAYEAPLVAARTRAKTAAVPKEAMLRVAVLVKITRRLFEALIRPETVVVDADPGPLVAITGFSWRVAMVSRCVHLANGLQHRFLIDPPLAIRMSARAANNLAQARCWNNRRGCLSAPRGAAHSQAAVAAEGFRVKLVHLRRQSCLFRGGQLAGEKAANNGRQGVRDLPGAIWIMMFHAVRDARLARGPHAYLCTIMAI